MTEPCVLMLDYTPTAGLSHTLRGILESARTPRIALRQEHVNQPDLAGAILRCDPAVVMMLLCHTRLDQAPEMVQSLRDKVQDRPLLLVADHCDPSVMFELLRHGASDFVTSPLRAAEILPRLWRLFGDHIWRGSEDNSPALKKLVGNSEAFLSQLRRIPMVARCEASVLIAGETGTGKELFARAIHQLSPRADGPFIPVNCGAIPVELVENELFGHERGAFTGANTARAGLIQEADGGTLFLDEIDSLPLLAQVKLLRFLQEKEYRVLGSPRTHHADVRVVTATNLDIEEAVRSGRLRQDLYYRLNIITLVLPPLRERPDDIPLLAEHFLRKYSARFGKAVTGFSAEARHALCLREWPGNVRELEHVVERAAALCEGICIEADDVKLERRPAAEAGASFHDAKARVVTQFERTYLRSLMVACDGNITKAAQVAGKNRRVFWELLRKHQIDARAFRVDELVGSAAR